MDQWIQSTLEQFGLMGVAFLMLIENIFPPIPSEVVMPWAGYSVSQGNHSFIAIISAGSFGSYLGALVWYGVGLWIGKDRLSRWADRHGAWLTLSSRDLDRVDRWFDTWGGWAVLICRLIPGVRTLISLPAGFSRMNFVRFAICTAIGTIAWTTLLAGLGWWLGNRYADLTGPLGWISTAVVVGLFAWWLFRLLTQRRWNKNPANAR